MRAVLLASLALLSCQKADETADQKPIEAVAKTGSGSAAIARPKTEQVAPPFDLKNPPPDATKTASGLIYKKITTNDAGQAPKRNDTALILYSGWHQASGETFVNHKTAGQPWGISLATAAPGFTEGLQLLKKGERAMLWMPPAIGYKGTPPSNAETNAYDVELVDIHAAPPVPDNVAKPPDNAQATKSGVKYVVVHPGTGTEKPKPYDNVTFNYTAWDAEGRMFDTTEMGAKKPSKASPYRQPPAYGEMLENMVAGQRVRFWVDSTKMQESGKPVPGMPTGQLCYEAEILSIEKGIEPPQTPPDVAKPPGDAKKTAKGVFYKMLKTGKGGPHPKPTDTVRVHYSGWTTDGKMFDSSVTRGEPSEFSLGGVIAGWTDGIPVLSVGDKARFWIPEELAYKGAPGKPQGMLVFDVELLEIKAPGAGPPMPPHGGPPMPPHGGPHGAMPPPPPQHP
jgi:FKBP-type peptidyl-prolyl cis-trans isomerase